MPGELQCPVPSKHTVIIVCSAYPEAGAKMLEVVRANAGKGKRYLSNFEPREDLGVFYARKVNALFYRSDTNNTTVIFTDKMDVKQFHVLQMLLPKYMPDLFKENPLTEKETALLKSLGNKSAVEYETLIAEYAKDLDIRAEIIRTKLAGFETAFERVRIDEVKTELNSLQNDYENCLSTIRELNKNIEEKRYVLAGLECALYNSADSGLIGYFMCNKNLSVIKVTGTAIEFVSHGYADIYDREAFDKYADNLDGFLYNGINPAVTKAQMQKLYNAIFAENKYKLRLCAAFTADMKNGLRAFQYYNFPLETKDYLPNPHIQNYGCVGSYAVRFQEYVNQKDYIGAIDQATVSGRNLNFYDSTVMSTFAKNLSGATVRCIEKSDGSLMTPIEAIRELEEDDQCQDR
jgi:hypothetical protein